MRSTGILVKGKSETHAQKHTHAKDSINKKKTTRLMYIHRSQETPSKPPKLEKPRTDFSLVASEGTSLKKAFCCLLHLVSNAAVEQPQEAYYINPHTHSDSHSHMQTCPQTHKYERFTHMHPC